MEIFGNMQVLPFLSYVLTSLKYHNGYYGCGGSQRYHYGRCAMLKLVFVAPKFRLLRVQKKWKKRAKNEKSRFAKITIFFLRVHEWDIVLGVNTDQKNRVGKVCSPKKIFEFWEPVKVRNFGNFVIYLSLRVSRRLSNVHLSIGNFIDLWSKNHCGE